MTTRKAALIIGCTINHVRTLIKAGKLYATKERRTYGYTLNVWDAQVYNYAATKPATGWPRGKGRKPKQAKRAS